MSKPRRLAIVQPVMKGYRLPFFAALQQRLAALAIELEVIYGRPWSEEAKRGDNVDLPAPLGRRVNSHMLGGKLLWMPVLGSLLKADGIVVEHANKNLINYPLALAQQLGARRVAYWGHGRDRQRSADSRGERFKRRSLHWADWWFAYTRGAASYVAAQGFDAHRITAVGNAVDTYELRDSVRSITPAERTRHLLSLGLEPDGQRLVYCGSLYANKRFDLMLPALVAAQAQAPQLQFIAIGGGPMADDMQAFAAAHSWARYVGPQFGRDKAALLSLADAWLNPGLVGLGILDAFSAGLPMITTDLPIHSPEIEYLEPGINGLMVAPEVPALAEALLQLLRSPEQLSRLRQGALASAERHSIEAMADNFAQGVQQWLK